MSRSKQKYTFYQQNRRIKCYNKKGLTKILAIPYFDIPLNLPHAGRIAEKICRLVEQRALGSDLRWFHLSESAEAMDRLLAPYRIADEDPPGDEAESVRTDAVALGRRLAEEIIRHNLGEDRIGQCIRNLFECLALGEEGAILSLRAGENPRSLQRPV